MEITVNHLNVHRADAGPEFDKYLRRLSGIKRRRFTTSIVDAWALVHSEPRYVWKIEYDAQGMYEWCVLIYNRDNPHKPVVASCAKSSQALAICYAYVELKRIEWKWKN